MKNKKAKTHFENSELTIKNILIRCVLFTLLFCLLGFLFVLTSSYFLYKTEDPTSFTEIAGIFSLFISAFLTSLIQSKINKQYYFSSSLILGILIFALTLIISLILPDSEFDITNFIWRILIPVFCILGGMLGIKRNNKKRKHHKS